MLNNRTKASHLSSWASAALLTGVLTAAGCATVTPAPLPPLPSDSEPELQGAYRGAEGAYSKCSDQYLEAQAPWQLYAAAGSGVLAVASVGTASALIPTVAVDRATLVALVASLGALGLVSAGAATYFGVETLDQWDRADAHQQVLKDANIKAGEAIGARNAMGLADLTRTLNENCRAVGACTGAEGAYAVIQDIERWREHARKLEADQAELERARSGANQELAAAQAKQAALDNRVRGLEGALSEREAENASLRGELSRLEEEQASLSKKQQKLLDEKRKLEDKTTHYEEVAASLKAEVDKGRVALRRLRNGVVVEMQNKVLFPSGSAELNDVGKETLTAVAGAIKDLKDRRVRIEGHTDNVPVGKKLSYDSNWELSAARAITVTKFMQENGVNPSIMSAEARSEYAPIASNKNPNGRARNRRIEIYLVPKPTGSKEGMKLNKQAGAE